MTQRNMNGELKCDTRVKFGLITENTHTNISWWRVVAGKRWEILKQSTQIFMHLNIDLRIFTEEKRQEPQNFNWSLHTYRYFNHIFTYY